MVNNKHLTLDCRITIQHKLENKDTFNSIAKFLDKDPCTVSNEVKSKYVHIRNGAKANRMPFSSYTVTICSSQMRNSK